MPMVKHHLGQVGKYDVYEQEGRVVCECMKWKPGQMYIPCEHVWKAIKSRMDGHRSSDTLFAGSVIVPMLEEDVLGVPFTVEVDVRPEEARHGMTPFYLDAPDWLTHEEFPFIGWLTADEGRQSMRRVILEFLRASYREVPACRDPFHSTHLLSKKERQELNLEETSPTVLASVASVFATGKCWRCRFGNDADDLVPDV